MQHRFIRLGLVFFFASLLGACNSNDKPKEQPDSTLPSLAPPAAMDYTVVKVYPHDTSSYTEGLLLHNNELYESTGREGFSKLAKINLETGKPVKEIALPKDVFGEGIVVFGNKIYQLTYRNQKVFVYDLNSFKKIQEFPWNGEGWALTHDGKNLIASNGSSNLQFIDPATFKVQKILGVTDNYGPVNNLNELEYVNGFIYANQFQTNYILKIDPESGRVVARADLKDIFKTAGKTLNESDLPDPDEDVLNGIAYDSTKSSFLIAGKQWPYLFEVKFK